MQPQIPCPDCAGKLYLRDKPTSWRGSSQYVYLCENWPECRGLMSAHADGRPCENPADAHTRKARRMVHALFDQLWENAPAMYGQDCTLKPAALRRIARNRAYKWLAEHMGMPFKECHVSMMNVNQLRHAWRTIKKHNPTPESVRAWAKEKRHVTATPGSPSKKTQAQRLCPDKRRLQNGETV